jgi:hypothetical protein
MKGFKIVALTKRGTSALNICIQENRVELSRQSYLNRMKFHKIWTEQISANPLTLIMSINPDAERFVFMDPNFSIKLCMDQVVDAMVLNDADINDFFIEELV